MIFGSCHFLFPQFTQRDEPNQIIADMDALAAFSAAFIRGPDIDRLDQLMGCITHIVFFDSSFLRIMAAKDTECF